MLGRLVVLETLERGKLGVRSVLDLLLWVPLAAAVGMVMAELGGGRFPGIDLRPSPSRWQRAHWAVQPPLG
jgi:hypothetical protein